MTAPKNISSVEDCVYYLELTRDAYLVMEFPQEAIEAYFNAFNNVIDYLYFKNVEYEDEYEAFTDAITLFTAVKRAILNYAQKNDLSNLMPYVNGYGEAVSLLRQYTGLGDFPWWSLDRANPMLVSFQTWTRRLDVSTMYGAKISRTSS